MTQASKKDSTAQAAPQETVDMLGALVGAGITDEFVAEAGEAAVTAPYFVTRTQADGSERVIYPTTYEPESVQARCCPLPTDDKGNVAHPFTLPIVDELLGTTGTLPGDKPRTYAAMAALFTHSGTVHPKASTVERSICVVFEGQDPAVFMSGTPKLVPMKQLPGVKKLRKARGEAEARYEVPSHYMKCRITQGVVDEGKAPVIILSAGARARFKEYTRKDKKGNVIRKVAQEDVAWANVTCSTRTSALSVARFSGTSKQLFNLIMKLSWLHQAREALKAAGSKTTLDAYHNAYITVSHVTYSRPANSGDTAKPELQATLCAVDDPKGVMHNAPAAYLWKGAELNLR